MVNLQVGRLLFERDGPLVRVHELETELLASVEVGFVTATALQEWLHEEVR